MLARVSCVVLSAVVKVALVPVSAPVTVKAAGVVKAPDNFADVIVLSIGTLISVCVIVTHSTADPAGGAVEKVRVVPDML